MHNLRVNPDVEIRDETVVRSMRVREVEDEAERMLLAPSAFIRTQLTGRRRTPQNTLSAVRHQNISDG